MKPFFPSWLLSVFLFVCVFFVCFCFFVVVTRLVINVPAALGIVQGKHPVPDLPIVHLLDCSLLISVRSTAWW